MLSEEEVLKALSSIKDSGSNRSVVDLGWLDQLRINHPKSIVRLNLPSYAQSQRDRIAAEAKKIVESFSEVSELQIELSNATGQSEIPSISLQYQKFQ